MLIKGLTKIPLSAFLTKLGNGCDYFCFSPSPVTALLATCQTTKIKNRVWLKTALHGTVQVASLARQLRVAEWAGLKFWKLIWRQRMWGPQFCTVANFWLHVLCMRAGPLLILTGGRSKQAWNSFPPQKKTPSFPLKRGKMWEGSHS